MTATDFGLRACLLSVAGSWFTFAALLVCDVAELGITEPRRVLRLPQHGEKGRNYRASHICPRRTDQRQQPMVE